jgi:hypothetical protein
MSSIGNDSGAGLPAAKAIIDGSVRDLNISLMAEGFIEASLSDILYSMKTPHNLFLKK